MHTHIYTHIEIKAELIDHQSNSWESSSSFLNALSLPVMIFSHTLHTLRFPQDYTDSFHLCYVFKQDTFICGITDKNFMKLGWKIVSG